MPITPKQMIVTALLNDFSLYVGVVTAGKTENVSNILDLLPCSDDFLMRRSPSINLDPSMVLN